MSNYKRREEEDKFEQERRVLESNLLLEEKQEKEQIYEVKFKKLALGHHADSISELHTCLQRPILLTMSLADQTIRIWNYVTNTCELIQKPKD